MALNYAMYRVHDGRRLRVGSLNNTNINYTKGPAQFTGAEFRHLLTYIKEVLGFHVYANSAFGGIHLTAHGRNSWHYVKDGTGQSLGADIGTYGDVNEYNRIVRDLIPVLDRLGVAWVYSRDGHVPAHDDHIHIDVGIYGNKGGTRANWYGYFQARRRGNPITALPLKGGSPDAGRGRKPKSVYASEGSKGLLVKVIQGMAGVDRDGIYGSGTTAGVKKLQRYLKVTADGKFGPETAKTWMYRQGPIAKGSDRSRAITLIQYIGGTDVDGIFGTGTEKVVKEMQEYAGITVDGIFGPNSVKNLFI